MKSSGLDLIRRLVPKLVSLFLIAASVLAIGTAPRSVFASDFENIRLEISSETGPRIYRIALDRIGLVSRENVTEKDIVDSSAGLKPESIDLIEQGIQIVIFDQALSRKTLHALSRVLSGLDKVRMAGLVLFQENSNTPILLNDMLIVGFKKDLDRSSVEAFARANGIEIVTSDKLVPRQWLFRLDDFSDRDVLDVIQDILIKNRAIVEFAIPNYAISIVSHQSWSSDPLLFSQQWHHHNYGQGGGTFDADADTDDAWSLTPGDSDVVIAVMDKGFDIEHPALAPNLWVNEGEQGSDSSGANKATNNCDDDQNGYDDDLHGFNFSECFFLGECPTNNTAGTANCPDTTNDFGSISDSRHGTAVAGVAVARPVNGNGVSGSCPQCSLMLIQVSSFALQWSLGEAIGYAGKMGADILNNSWGYPPEADVPDNVVNAVNTVVNHGTIIFWSMNNEPVDDCAGTSSVIYDNPGVIPISAASNWDKKVRETGYGECLGVLAPAFSGFGPNPNPLPDNPGLVGQGYTGTLNMVTTDQRASLGYNDTRVPANNPGYDPTFCNSGSDSSNQDYTLCFSGTSAASPMAAGVGGLVRSVDPEIDVETMKRLLQDTADKIEPMAANYSPKHGQSANEPPTHGFGRINAFEALKVIAPVTENDVTRPGGVDLFLRDNKFDWGNTAQSIENGPPWRGGSNVLLTRKRNFIAHYHSVDIKVDAPPFKPAPLTSRDFDNFVHENPVSGLMNRVYVRVHNRGTKPATEVEVKLYSAFAGTALPAFPSDFWSTSPSLPSKWKHVGTRAVAEVGYSGATVAGKATDQSKIVSFNFMGPRLNPLNRQFRHHCLLAIVDSPDDPVNEDRLIPDIVTPTNNNVTHRNLLVQDSTAPVDRFFLTVRNPFPRPIDTRLRVIKPRNWDVVLGRFGDGKPFSLAPGEEKTVQVKITGRPGLSDIEVEIRQEVRYRDKYHPFGGFTFRFP
ncbi:MAG: S8 family serine peptidase [Gammaproteobacteria bacterium]|nr:S8 family serine peptidase [Gammaproteobacteria bacterium]